MWISPGIWRRASRWNETLVSRLLVTGGAGFIGSNFVHYWLRRIPPSGSWCWMR